MTPIAGRYQPLDAGRSSGPVRVRDLQTAQTLWLRDVAVPLGAQEEALARLQSAKGIFHPSLVTLFDVVPQPAHRVLLAYEFVPAQSVAQFGGGQPFNAKRAAGILSEVADAVAELHARGICHGAISQQTVLVTLKGKAKLDRIADPSLEIARDLSPDADISSLGALLQQLVENAPAVAPGVTAIGVIIERVRQRRIDSAAMLAATLRRI